MTAQDEKAISQPTVTPEMIEARARLKNGSMPDELNTTVTVSRWALQFIMDNACFQDEGPMHEGWRSDEMRRATDILEKALEEQNAE